jgi:hypothetical protein
MTVLCTLFPPFVSYHCDLFSQGDDALYKKGQAWGILALFILVLVNRQLQEPNQVIEHPDRRCVSETVGWDHRFVARFRAEEEYVVPGEVGLHFLQSGGGSDRQAQHP